MTTTMAPRRWPRRIGWALLAIIGGMIAAYIALRTPDTDRAAMIAKYGGPNAQFVTTPDGARVHVRDTGGLADLPVMVLIHGSNASLHTWEPLVARLRSEYRIITMDMPGHGLTGATPTGRYDMDEMVATVDAVTRHFGVERFVLGGNSMGGGISWRYAVAHPARVQGLVLLDASGMPPRPADAAPASNIGFRIMGTSIGRWISQSVTPRPLIEQSLRGSVSNQAIVTPATVDQYWELLRFPGNRAATAARFGRPLVDVAAAERARSIRVPTLILFGAEDRLINPSAATSFAERIADSETVILPGVGHLPMVEAPDATAEAIRAFFDRAGQEPA